MTGKFIKHYHDNCYRIQRKNNISHKGMTIAGQLLPDFSHEEKCLHV